MTQFTRSGRLTLVAALCAPVVVCAAASAQVFIVQPAHVEMHYTQFDPTNVKLSSEPLTTIAREELVRFMQAEQGFAMRPLPVANLDLEANGHMTPGGEKYVDLLHTKGISVKPGDRVVVTDIRIRDNAIVIDLNNGPEHKHKYLRHVSIGMGEADTPLAQDSGAPPSGSRITLTFPKRVPDLTGEQLEALLRPMVDFGVKSPAEAYAESLPPFLQKAILAHRVLVGMDRDMVIYAKGQPIRKVREQENGKPFEIWIYGEAPQPVEFVRFVDSYVVRVELAKVGEAMTVRTGNEMGDFWGNQPVVAANQHEVKLGDQTAADRTEEDAPIAPPTLRKPGEQLPADTDKDRQTMAPMNYPPGMSRPGDPGYTPTVSAKPASTTPASGSTPAAGSGSTGSNPAQAPASGTPATPAQQPASSTPPPSSTPQWLPSSQ
ncbi:MAG: hypothetical protein WA414_07270 [Acidobacteriaceae bacterium]